MTSFYLKLCTDYYDELIASGRRDMAAAFTEYSRDVDRGRVYKYQDYAKYWFNDYSRKDKSFRWIVKFKEVLEAFKISSETSYAKKPMQPKCNEDATAMQPNTTDTTDFIDGTCNEDTTTMQPKCNISINSINNKRIIKREEKEKLTLPDCISESVWASWLSYRTERKLTKATSTLKAQINKLEKWYNEGHEPNDIINASISNGWQGLFEPKQKQKSTALTTPSNNKSMAITTNEAPWVKEARMKREKAEEQQAQLQHHGFANYLDYLENRDAV